MAILDFLSGGSTKKQSATFGSGGNVSESYQTSSQLTTTYAPQTTSSRSTVFAPSYSIITGSPYAQNSPSVAPMVSAQPSQIFQLPQTQAQQTTPESGPFNLSSGSTLLAVALLAGGVALVALSGRGN